jgi:hypothetical protein
MATKTDKHTVQCRSCGKTVTDLTKLRSEIRKELKEQGWRVAVPKWHTRPFAVQLRAKGQYYAKYPKDRRVTVDQCPTCADDLASQIDPSTPPQEDPDET